MPVLLHLASIHPASSVPAVQCQPLLITQRPPFRDLDAPDVTLLRRDASRQVPLSEISCCNLYSRIACWIECLDSQHHYLCWDMRACAEGPRSTGSPTTLMHAHLPPHCQVAAWKLSYRVPAAGAVPSSGPLFSTPPTNPAAQETVSDKLLEHAAAGGEMPLCLLPICGSLPLFISISPQICVFTSPTGAPGAAPSRPPRPPRPPPPPHRPDEPRPAWNKTQVMLLHAVLMAAAWLLLIPLGSLTARHR